MATVWSCPCCLRFKFSPEEIEQRYKSQEIDRMIEKDKQSLKRQVKLLLLGAGESGKSTFLKQMRIIHGMKFDNELIKEFQHIIYQNVVKGMKVLVDARDKLGIPWEHVSNSDLGMHILKFENSMMLDAKLFMHYAPSLKILWEDAGIRRAFDRRREFQLSDSVQYFLDNLDRIAKPEYIPTHQDILHCRKATKGITECVIPINKIPFLFVDVGGQRSQRQKWFQCFDCVTSILFLVSSSEFDQVLLEDRSIMGECFISSLHIQKLGHQLEEIRIRALNHIISKLDHVPVSNFDFSRCLDLLKKLFEWFDFEPQKEEEKVLNLMQRLFKSDDGVAIVKHVGVVALNADLQKIRYKIKEQYYAPLDKIIEIINMNDETPGVVPPLISELPLSYRSDQGINNAISNTTAQTNNIDNNDNVNVNINSARSRSSLPEKPTTPPIRTIYFHENGKDSHSFNNIIQCGTTASTISGLEMKSFSVSGLQTCRPYEDNRLLSDSVPVIRDLLYKSVPFVTLKWQELSKSDCHVLKSVEESLQRPPQPSILINSCDFFCNVMLQDFPAEIFLQRPTILTLFYDMINTSPSTRITNAALTCLNKLSENLIVRLRYYSDPCTFNLKQGLSLMYELDSNATSARKGFCYNIDINLKNVDDTESEDTNLLQCNQFTLPQYCIQTFNCVLTYMAEKPQSFRDSTNKKKTQSGINTALQLIDKLVTLMTICIKPCIWDCQGDSTINDIVKQLIKCLEKIGNVLEQYRLIVVASDMEYFDRMAQLFLLHATSYLLTEIIPITKADVILPRTLKNSLSSCLLDASFSRLYPAAHQALLQYINELKGLQETESLAKYKDVQSVCQAMTKAIPLIKNNLNCHSIDNLILILHSLPSLEFHKNLNIINTFLKICVKNINLIKTNERYENTISEILVTLLSHVDKDIREETYSLCQKLIVNILGLNHTKHMNELEPGSQILFFLQPDVIIEIASHGLNSTSIQIQTYAEDILIHLLKCKYLVCDFVWKKVIHALMLAMPIIQCYADCDTPLGKSIVKIMDPDISPSLFLSQTDIIKGNLRMLYCKDKRLRNEAVSRLCWMLTTEENAFDKIPRIKSLDDCGLSYIFQFDYPIDFTRQRPTKQYYQSSNLLQVMELLESPSIEPSLRRSALTQVSVMLEDHFMLSTFLDRNGLELILEILESSLHEQEYHNYPDSVIPIISILKYICLYNSVLRHELSHNIKVLFNILRGLILYCTDKRVQNDGAMLCCLLLFCEFAFYNYSNNDFTNFSLPAIVVDKYNMPFKCNVHWKVSRHQKTSLTELLMSDDWCKSTLRMHWNIEWNGGICELITWPCVQNCDQLSAEQQAEFSIDLRLKNVDLKALKASSIDYCCKQYLLDIENATTHQSVLEAIRGIAGYISLWLLTYKNKNTVPNESLLELPWNSSFFRFLSAPPANHEDQNLLVELLRCLTIMLNLYKNSRKNCWIVDVLQDTAHYLSRLLKIDVNNEHRFISMELLTLIAKCSTLYQTHLENISLSQIDCLNDKAKAKPKKWLNIIEIIIENLKYSDCEQFYNLAYLDRLLSCMVDITSDLGWSECSADFHKLFPELIEAISELLTAFHYGKGAEAASSFMGMNITRNALYTMNHILYEMQQTYKKKWDNYWVHDAVFSTTVFSLFSLWSCRDVMVRAATLQLLSGLALSPRGATLIVENVRHKSNNIWETALMTLLDHSEASVVREQAAVLLTNLTSHVNISATGQMTLPLCHAPISFRKEMSGTEAVLLLLKEYNFFEEISVLLSCLYLDLHLEPSVICFSQKIIQKNECLTARSYVPTSTSSKSSETGVNVFVTPTLIKAVADFFNNLLHLAPASIANHLSASDNELIRSFFRCLTAPTKGCSENENAQFLLYCDTLQMCSAICSTLTRSVLQNSSCRSIVMHTRDCLYVLMYLLNPNLYIIDPNKPQFLYLRNQLWSEIFRLMTALMEFNNQTHSYDTYKESYDIFTSLLCEIGPKSFIHSICESIESKTAPQTLQKSALQSLTTLLSVERVLSTNNIITANSSFSLQKLCDYTKTPRCSMISVNNHHESSKRSSRMYHVDSSNFHMSIMIGEDLCKILLKLYDIQSIEMASDSKRKSIIIGTLSSLLNISKEAKKFALKEGFLGTILDHLKRLHVELSLHSAENLRKVTEKKKICPMLKEVDSLFCLLANFISGNETVKKKAANSDLADIIHKYWVWFTFDHAMLINILKLLCTFTTNEDACQSLTLTNPIPGSGPRKVPANISLLTTLIQLILKEMDLVNRKHDTLMLQLSFHIIQNTCFVQECRAIIVKTNLFQCFNKLHPAITKRQKPWELIELLWLEFLQVFTYYPEGQVHVVKTNDVLDLLITLTNGQKSTNKFAALSILRNVAFYQTNRIKLLGSVDFIQLLLNKLTNGTNEEKHIVVSIIWVLAANSQKSKIALKCAGLDKKLRENIKIYQMQGIQDKSYEMMVYVLGVLREGEK